MAWVELTAAAFRNRLSATEAQSLLEECPTPDAKLDAILEQVAHDFAANINVGRRKRGLALVESTGSYVPPGSVRHAFTLARQLLTESFPALAEYNGEDRRKAYDQAEDHLAKLADNRADADDLGAEDFEPATPGAPFRYGGSNLMDFTQF